MVMAGVRQQLVTLFFASSSFCNCSYSWEKHFKNSQSRLVFIEAWQRQIWAQILPSYFWPSPYLPMIIALISFRISFMEGTVEDRTIEEEAIAFSMFSTNLSITGLLNELLTVFSATEQGVLQRHTNQNNQPHLPFDQPQTFLRKSGYWVDIFSQTPVIPFYKMPLHSNTGHTHVLVITWFHWSVAWNIYIKSRCWKSRVFNCCHISTSLELIW